MHNQKYDPAMEELKPGKHVGIVGESHIWDGPLDQAGRQHGMGSSSGITGPNTCLLYTSPSPRD